MAENEINLENLKNKDPALLSDMFAAGILLSLNKKCCHFVVLSCFVIMFNRVRKFCLQDFN